MAGPIENFGRTEVPLPRRAAEGSAVLAAFRDARPDAPLLPFGNGRSYGDSCLIQHGTHADMRMMNRVLNFDRDTGEIEAEPGVLLGELLAILHGTGWFAPVVPGTQFVTLGGALANDIHGKNHHVTGTFGRHVPRFTLARSDGSLFACSAVENPELYGATIGGMGLTGIITRLTMKLARVPSHAVRQRNVAFRSLDGYFDAIDAEGDAHEYAVAWIDQLATGASFGRGVLMLGDHADEDLAARPGMKLAVPFQPPFNLLNGVSLKLFNIAFNAAKARKTEWHTTSAQAFFFPLDSIAHWNRLYGPRGLYQHQSVLPPETARRAIPAMLKATHEAGEASFLTVLKKFGTVASPGLMSFPRPGHTLTLDFPNRGRRTLALLDKLDAIVTEAGGAVNPYKDARMSPAVFAASFPRWRDLEALRDPACLSDFWTRTALKLNEINVNAQI
jgi:FAD/FMN-containing dehydrogenase